MATARVKPHSGDKPKLGAFVPMRVSKWLVIQYLESRPEDLPKVAPNWDGTAADFVQALRDDPHEWIVDGILCE